MSLRHASEAQHSFGTTVAAATINALPAVAGRRLFVYRLLITTSLAATFKLQDTAANDMSQAFQLAATGGIALDVPFNYDPWWFTGQGQVQPGNPYFGIGVGINFIVTGAPTLGWDIWWDAHV
jgi:hypothetical protein